MHNFGFIGQMGDIGQHAFGLAVGAISSATNRDRDAIVAFLHSKHGRHFADDVLMLMQSRLELKQAIQAAVQKWQAWRITKQISKQHGIPMGMTYLDGFVADFENDIFVGDLCAKH